MPTDVEILMALEVDLADDGGEGSLLDDDPATRLLVDEAAREAGHAD